jgi:hypothetical protein
MLFILPFSAYSDYEITLQWEATDPEPAGYRLYGREAGYSYDYDEFWCQSDTSDTRCTIDQLDENTTYYFVVRAFDEDGNESTNSNEVGYRYQGTETTDDSQSSGSSSSSGSGSSDSFTTGCFIDTLMSR